MSHTSLIWAVEEDSGEIYFSWRDAEGCERRLRVTHLPLMTSQKEER